MKERVRDAGLQCQRRPWKHARTSILPVKTACSFELSSVFGRHMNVENFLSGFETHDWNIASGTFGSIACKDNASTKVKWQHLCIVSTNVTSFAELAIAFSLRQNSVLATDALRTWLNAYATRLSAQRFADQFHATHLQHQMFFLWRRAVRKKQKIARAARVAEKYLVLRRTWNAWRERVAASKRDKKVKELDVMRTTRLFNCSLLFLPARVQYLISTQIGRVVSVARSSSDLRKNRFRRWYPL